MPHRTPLSCYVRTMNEGARLGATLAAARRVADEIVVVDSGSTDDTVAVAEAAGARVLRQPWLGGGRQKRVGEDACANDWLLDIDADEILSEALIAEIAALMGDGPPPRAAYAAPVAYMSPLPGPARALGAARRIKLYDRRATRAPDSALADAIDPPPGGAGKLRGAIEHHSFADAADLTAKLNARSTRNARMAKPKALWLLRLRIVFGLPLYIGKGLLSRGMLRGGTYGFALATMVAVGRWLRDVKMYERARGLGAEKADRDAPR